MRLRLCAAALLASVLPLQNALAQAIITVPTGGSSPPPVPVSPPPDASDSPEEIARDAARDLRDSRFYNRPGATRAQYDSDWQECRLIARGSRTPSGSVPYYYDPTVISPLGAAIGAGIGGAIASAIAEGQQRRANRRNCLLIRGWRLVEVPAAEAARVREMSDEQRSAYFDSIVGAERVEGTVTARTSFTLAPDPAINPAAPVVGAGSVFVGRRVDPAAPFELAPGEAAVVIAYRRPDAGSAGRSGTVELARYDPAVRDLVYQPRDWRRRGDTGTYRITAASVDRRAPLEVQVLRVTPGDYVIAGHAVGRVPVTTSFCFGAPTFRVGAGDILYLGDFVPYMDIALANGDRLSELAYGSNIEDSRRTLASVQPRLAEALQPAQLRNRATYACSAITMSRWDLPGVDALPDPGPAGQGGERETTAPATGG